MSHKESRRGELKDAVRLARLSSIGLTLVIATLIGLFGGMYLDKVFKTHSIFTIVFLLLGIAAGFINVFRTIRRDALEPDNGNDHRPA